MRRGRHRLKSRASQERRQVAALDSWRRYRETMEGFAAGTSAFTDGLETLRVSLNRFAGSVFDALERYRRQDDGACFVHDDQVDATTYAFTAASWAQAKRERADAIFGEAGSGHRVYGDYSWSASEVIDVDGHVVEPEPAPSALEVYRGR